MAARMVIPPSSTAANVTILEYKFITHLQGVTLPSTQSRSPALVFKRGCSSHFNSLDFFISSAAVVPFLDLYRPPYVHTDRHHGVQVDCSD
jgi:hypothetical protein